MENVYETFDEFYPFYLSQHTKIGTKVSHCAGLSLFFVLAAFSLIFLNLLYFIAGIIIAYLFSWIGHFFIEKNRPATFTYPLMSLRGDFKMYFQILSGKIKFKN